MLKNILALSAVALMSATGMAEARDQIRIVGSSTVFPFSTAVAERFGKTTDFKTPVVESTGSGGGLKLFCAGAGEDTPDITNASRRIKKSEIELCAKNGVRDIIEVKVGYDGIVIANTRTAQQLDLSRKDLFLALAKEIVVGGKVVSNPNKTWKDVNASLPAIKIEVMGPPPTSGTRDAFVELVMDEGCDEIAEIKAMKKTDKNAHKAICQTMREDGGFIEAGENDNLIVQKLNANPDAFGIFGYSFLDQNSDTVQGSKIVGMDPTFENIADGKYPVSRPLYFYVKKSHVDMVPGLKEYMAEFTADATWGNEGYLTDKGLIPLGDTERTDWSNKVKSLANLSM